MEKSFITNVSFPKSLDEVLYFINVRGKFDVEEIMSSKYVEWTAPKSAHVGEAALIPLLWSSRPLTSRNSEASFPFRELVQLRSSMTPMMKCCDRFVRCSYCG